MRPGFAVSLADYEGPLDLLLELLREHKLAIDEVSVSMVASQFLAYVEQALDLDLSLSGDWIEMAAKLIHWKSRSLLPPANAPAPDTPDREYGRFLDALREHSRRAAIALADRKAEADARLSRREAGTPGGEDPEEDDGAAFTLWDLIQLCERHARDSAPGAPARVLEPEVWTVEEAMAWTEERLTTAFGPLPLEILFHQRPALPQKIALFLGVLELGKARAIQIEQAAEPFAPIFLLPAP